MKPEMKLNEKIQRELGNVHFDIKKYLPSCWKSNNWQNEEINEYLLPPWFLRIFFIFINMYIHPDLEDDIKMQMFIILF